MSVVALPPPPTPADVSLSANGSPGAQSPTLSPEATTSTNAAPPPPVQTTADGMLADEFRGMTPKQIEDFKKTATPETHDTNIGLVAQAVMSYYNEFGHTPKTLDQLVTTGFLTRVPNAPKGKKYEIDAASVSVKTVDQ